MDLRLSHKQALHPRDQSPKYADLKDFIQCYNPENRRERTESGQFPCLQL